MMKKYIYLDGKPVAEGVAILKERDGSQWVMEKGVDSVEWRQVIEQIQVPIMPPPVPTKGGVSLDFEEKVLASLKRIEDLL
jgi:hypothetical protein